jgi:hypothetical protein
MRAITAKKLLAAMNSPMRLIQFWSRESGFWADWSCVDPSSVMGALGKEKIDKTL